MDRNVLAHIPDHRLTRHKFQSNSVPEGGLMGFGRLLHLRARLDVVCELVVEVDRTRDAER